MCCALATISLHKPFFIVFPFSSNHTTTTTTWQQSQVHPISTFHSVSHQYFFNKHSDRFYVVFLEFTQCGSSVIKLLGLSCPYANVNGALILESYNMKVIIKR